MNAPAFLDVNETGHALTVRDWFASPIEGGDGNREFFVWAQPTACEEEPT